MNSAEFKKEFLEEVKIASQAAGTGSTAAFVENVSEHLIESEVLPDFTPSFFKGKKGRSNFRIDGYAFDELDHTMNLIIADYEEDDPEKHITNTIANHDFGELRIFLDAALKTDLYIDMEPSMPYAGLVDTLREMAGKKEVQKYRFFIFTNMEMSAAIKTVVLDPYDDVVVEGQIWTIERLFQVCSSNMGREAIEIDFKKYCQDFCAATGDTDYEEGIPCLSASSVRTHGYDSYLGVIPGEVLADIYDEYGSRLLEGNVRSFLSTKVAVNKKIRGTILREPEMFFAFNNGISVTAKDIQIREINHKKYITGARDFQIINGGQTTASIANARYKDKCELSSIYVQMKLISITEAEPEKADELIRNISRSSNSQNKVSDADFFASHPFHKQMEQISRLLFAPAHGGAQYETKWFYERARGQYLQEQMRLTAGEKKKYKLKHPKNQVIKKTDLAKVQNTWRGYPHIVSKGAQTNFNEFAKYIDEQWQKNKDNFNDRYYKCTASLMILFQYLEKAIPKQNWYQGGYRANIIYYTLALFRRLVQQQFGGQDFDLMRIWDKQEVPDIVGTTLVGLSEIVMEEITDEERPVLNVTQWCKKEACWTGVKKINVKLPFQIESFTISKAKEKEEKKGARGIQILLNGINAQTAVVKYPVDMWKRLNHFSMQQHIAGPSEVKALAVACKLPEKVPNSYQSEQLLKLLERAKEAGFNANV